MTPLKPTVLWVSGPPACGKSTVSARLEARGLPVFQTDKFIISLPYWCQDEALVEQARSFGSRRIADFLEAVASNGQATNLANLLLDPERGFHSDADTSIIEGHMPAPIQQKVVEALENRGYQVWIVQRVPGRNGF